VKDNYQTDGLPTSDGSVLFADFRPSPDATIVRRLREAGVVVLAKSNMHEFAYGIESYGSLFGQVRNPYNPERNAGGSSGGTGAAVAAGFAAAGLGSDTCGSIRIPAAHNNLVGLRPTMGVTSRYGIVPLASTQDIGGPITRSVADLALMLDAVAGFDPRDAATAESVGRVPASYTDYLRPDGLRGARLGVLAELFGSEARDQPVTAVVRAALGQASARGAAVVDVEVKDLAVLLKDASVVREEFPFDIERYLSQFPDAPYKTFQQILESGRWHPRLKERMTRSAAVRSSLSPEYLERIKRRTTIRYAVLSVMAEQQLDALVYPTIRRVAAPLAEEQAGSTCALSAVTGLPAMVVPAGFDPDGLPVGVELLGAAFAEPKLISLGYALEQATRYRRLPSTTPPLAARQ